MADHDRAQRPCEVADGKDAERGERLGDPVAAGEEGRADLKGEEAVDREVVPLQDVADRPGRNQA